LSLNKATYSSYNSSLLYLDEVRKDISSFDIIDAKIDAVSGDFFKKLNINLFLRYYNSQKLDVYEIILIDKV